MLKKIIRSGCALLLVVCLIFTSGAAGVKAETKTGVGMCEWAFRAYREGWKYTYGGSSVGAVDCSGLIRSYAKCGGGALAILNASPQSGSILSMPRIHGLGLWCSGHAGVYVGKDKDGTNMSIDMRNSQVNVVYSTMDSRSWNPWVKWFKIPGVTYPTNGWVTYNGCKYYYHNGQYVVGLFTVNGVTYDFGKSGALVKQVSASTTTTTAKTTTTTKKATTTTAATTTKKTTTATTAAKSAGLSVSSQTPSTYTLAGNIASYIDLSNITVRLYQNKKLISTRVCTYYYEFNGLAPGVYTISIAKKNHGTHTYSVTVKGNTTQHVYIRPLGDINGDLKLSNTDVKSIQAHVNGTAKLTGYKLILADVNSDGVVNITDYNLALAHSKGKSSVWK